MNIFSQRSDELQTAYEEGIIHGVETVCAELTETFKDIPMWGSVAVYHINKLLENFNKEKDAR
jgi:hypothetical protein